MYVQCKAAALVINLAVSIGVKFPNYTIVHTDLAFSHLRQTVDPLNYWSKMHDALCDLPAAVLPSCTQCALTQSTA